MELSTAWLVWPISLVTFLVLSYKSYQRKIILFSWPLLVSQLSALFMWSCLAAFSIGKFHYRITGKQMLKGDYTASRDISMIALLENAIELEPLNLFLYTWRFF